MPWVDNESKAAHEQNGWTNAFMVYVGLYYAFQHQIEEVTGKWQPVSNTSFGLNGAERSFLFWTKLKVVLNATDLTDCRQAEIYATAKAAELTAALFNFLLSGIFPGVFFVLKEIVDQRKLLELFKGF